MTDTTAPNTEPFTGVVAETRARLGAQVSPVVVGVDHVLDSLVVALAVGGHVLLEGVPGVAKTLLAEATARALGARFRRAQFTPDMLPSDLTGTMTLRGGDLGGGDLVFRPGPVFTNVLLADEINRTPPKTQAALLEAMAEGQVTVDGTSRRLADPFLVIATQNPIEYEGTYPLPEAQLDRFLVKVVIGYPAEEAELAMLGLYRSGLAPAGLRSIRPIVAADPAGETAAAVADLVASMRAEVQATTVTEDVARYVLAIVRATRALPSVEVGASPRAAVHLLAASRAAALLAGRNYVSPDDVVAVARPVLSHRLVLQADAEMDRFTTDDAVAAALASVPVPR